MRATRLDNGLKVLIQEEHTAPLASVWCWYKVGSKDERPGLTGVSHWCEHMNFKGTANIPRDQVKGIIEKYGGSWNGYTWIDQTTYLETATSDALDRMLFIEAERMASCLGHRYGVRLPSISANLYRDGNDSVAWHGDRIGRVRADAVVAIVSLGATRTLLLRPDGGGPSLSFPLHSGDLLVQGGTCQRTFEHCVPKRAHAGPRISVMFRQQGGN